MKGRKDLVLLIFSIRQNETAPQTGPSRKCNESERVSGSHSELS